MKVTSHSMLGKQVKLKSFQNSQQPLGFTKAQDNYWLLIGQLGRVLTVDELEGLAPHERGRRLLVEFSVDVASKGLACHNKQPNTLWIFETDLELALPDANSTC